MSFKNKKNIDNHKSYPIYITILILFFTIVFLSIGFSSFQNNLAIDNISATIRIDKDIRITNININSANNATSNYEEYNATSISGSINLPTQNSYIIYNVYIYNLGNIPMGITDISINNENLKYEVLNYNLKDKICENNQCSLGVKKTLQIKISYKDNVNPTDTENIFNLNFNFGRFFNISYYNITNSESLPKEIIEGDTLNINIPNNEDYLIKVFMNNKLLSKDKEYTHANDTLNIPNITGDLKINYRMPICQRATILHTEECKGNYCNGMGYKPGGAMGGSTITYGKLGTPGTLKSGDAFDCDVNGDGIYDAETERFYYVTDLENNSDVAVLIYYNNVSEGAPSNDKYYQYYTLPENWHGPENAIKQLPTTSQWSNVTLVNSERKIINEYGTTSTKDGHSFPEIFSYSKYAARFLTMGEVKKLVDFYIPTWKNGELNDHLYLVENTNFSKKDNSKFDGFWLETPRNTMSSHAWIIYATARRVHSVEVQSTKVIIGVRPVIEVYKSDMLYQ